MIFTFFAISFFVFLVVGVLSWVWPGVLWSLVFFGPLFGYGLVDLLQKRKGVRRNFPVIGNLRYFFESIRPELQQYFVESNHSGRPISRENRSVVYQRAKGQLQSLPFGTQQDVYSPSYEWINHSIVPVKVELDNTRVLIGGPQCLQPYSSSLFNISAMSYGALSKNAISALNLAAESGGFYHNTGEGGISPYHLKGGDLVWQLGTGYFGCRKPDGRFDAELFKTKVAEPKIKMIEVKLSQGAKPGKGGLLPGAKVNREVAEIRGVEIGKDVVSPSAHPEFQTPVELLQFLQKLRELSLGKPVGFKLCVGRKSEFVAICKAMLKLNIYPDFITVDGAEGGTGAAPLEYTNWVGTPLEEGLSFVHDMLVGYGLREQITIIAAGKVITAFDMLKKIALGADVLNSSRGMMLALGCIQALKCNSNKCPVGVATNDPKLTRGLYVPDKFARVARYHSETIHAFADILGSMGYHSPVQLSRADIYRRISEHEVKTYDELFPDIPEASLLNESNLPHLPNEYLKAIRSARADTFEPTLVETHSRPGGDRFLVRNVR